MGRFDERYTEPQRQAVGQAMLDPHPITGKRVTAREAVDSLNRGELGCPPPQEPMPVTTAYWCRDRERERRQGFTLSPEARAALEEPEKVTDRMNQRILSIHERQIEKLEAQTAKGHIDPRLYGIVIKNHREVMAAIKPPGPSKIGKPPKTSTNVPEKPIEDEVTKLAKAHAETRRGVAA